MVLNLDYVGSVGKHQWTTTKANTAEFPGPGNPQLRAQYPQYGPIGYYGTEDPTSYNALQAKLMRQLFRGSNFYGLLYLVEVDGRPVRSLWKPTARVVRLQ